MEKIRIACEVKDHLPLAELIEFQGALKDLSDEDAVALRKEILTTGFAFPVYVWRDKKKNFIVGGHQRVKVLRLLEADGIGVPDVPVVFIKAKNADEARRRVLQDVSQYGRVTQTGLYEFMETSHINYADLTANFRIPELDPEAFRSAFFPDTKKVEFQTSTRPGATELPESEFQEFKHKCPRCHFEWNDA